MSAGTIVWVIIVIIVVLVILGLIAALVTRSARRRREHVHRERAGELREQAAAQESDIRRHQAAADETEAEARQARAEAERKEAEARRLEEEAQARRDAADEHLGRHQETLREADAMDPDVPGDGSEGPREGPHLPPGGTTATGGVAVDEAAAGDSATDAPTGSTEPRVPGQHRSDQV
jgi:membrane protein involved in colicin uptake